MSLQRVGPISRLEEQRANPSARRSRSPFWLASMAASLTALVGCGAQEQAAPPSIAPPVLVAGVQIRDVTDRIEATGELIAQAEATIAAQVGGQITNIAVEEGGAVEAGQVLLEIDPQRRELELMDAEAKLAQAKAQLAKSQREWQRMQQLSKSAAASQARVEAAQTEQSLAWSRVTGAQARLGLAQRALADSTVRAPFGGLVSSRHVSFGEYVTKGLPLFDVVALDPIEVQFTLAEIDSAKVDIGHTVEIAVAPYPDERFTAKVTVISPIIDPSTRTLRVKAELPNPDERLRPGLFAHADLGVSHRSGVSMVPVEAVVQRADGAVLFRLLDGPRVERMAVQTGVRAEGWIEIVDGLDRGDRIVIRGQRDLVDGVTVSLRTKGGEVPGESAPQTSSARTDLQAARESGG